MTVQVWTADLAIGHADLDRQHRHLFAQFQEMLAASQQDAGRLWALLENFGDRAQEHFSAEERHMGAMGYPQLNYHRVDHVAFAHELGAALNRLQESEFSSESMRETYGQLIAWWVRHIHNFDKPLGKFLLRGEPSRVV